MSTQDEHNVNAATLHAVNESIAPAQNSPSSSLYTRTKLKATSGKRKNKAKELVKDVRDRELDLVSDPALGNPDDGGVLDLADQLLQQLDAGAEVDEAVEEIPPPTALPGSRSGATLKPAESVRSGDSASSSSRMSDLGHSIRDALSPGSGSTGRKVSRGQARKERKEAEEEAMRAQAREEVRSGGGRDHAAEEQAGFQTICNEHKLRMVEMPPDGHCLFSAVADQLNLLGHRRRTYTYQDTRRAAADYMRGHPDDFLPYLTIEDIPDEEHGDVSDRKFAKYCDKIEQTGEWGGQTEILALSHVFQLPIEVYAADAPVVKNGEDYARTAPSARISFHQHMYGLGSHYNSLHPAS